MERSGTGQEWRAVFTELVSILIPEMMKIINTQKFAKGVFDMNTPS